MHDCILDLQPSRGTASEVATNRRPSLALLIGDCRVTCSMHDSAIGRVHAHLQDALVYVRPHQRALSCRSPRDPEPVADQRRFMSMLSLTNPKTHALRANFNGYTDLTTQCPRLAESNPQSGYYRPTISRSCALRTCVLWTRPVTNHLYPYVLRTKRSDDICFCFRLWFM